MKRRSIDRIQELDMAKNSNQKLKLLYLVKILTEQSDEEHCLGHRH